jgi:hypothetical protein
VDRPSEHEDAAGEAGHGLVVAVARPGEGGLGGRETACPAALKRAARALPRALDPTAGGLPPGRDLAVLAYWAMAGLAVSLVTFRWHPVRVRGR